MTYKKITIEVPDTLNETEVKDWVLIKVERHLRAIEEPKLTSVKEVLEPMLEEYKTKNNIIKEIDTIQNEPRS
jgi:hypothetical protein